MQEVILHHFVGSIRREMEVVGWDTTEMADYYLHLTEEATRDKLTGILPLLDAT